MKVEKLMPTLNKFQDDLKKMEKTLMAFSNQLYEAEALDTVEQLDWAAINVRDALDDLEEARYTLMNIDYEKVYGETDDTV